ncbi:DNA-binding response regulator, partial [Streptomyces achromogenes]
MRAVLPDVLTDVLARHGDRVAVTDADGLLGYADLAVRAHAAADRLARYDVRGEPPRVGLYATNSVEYVEERYATELLAGSSRGVGY